MRITQAMRFAVEKRLLAGLLLAVCLVGYVDSAEDATPGRPFAGRPPAYQRQRAVRPIDTGRVEGRRSEMPYRRTRPSAPGPFFRHRSAQPHVAHGAWFQRPYPYHLDYYRLRYGGTYEPYYSGGLYGTPQVIVPPAIGYGYSRPFGYGIPNQPVPAGGVPPESPPEP